MKEEKPVPVKYYFSARYLQTLKEHKARHAAKGNGFGYEVVADEAVSNEVVCERMGRDVNLVFDDRITDFTPTTDIKGEVSREGLRRMPTRMGPPARFSRRICDCRVRRICL